MTKKHQDDMYFPSLGGFILHLRAQDMRAPLYLVCAALAVAAQSEDNQNFMGLEPMNVAADPETINYLLPKLTAKYRPSTEWRGVTDPRFYVLTEMDSNDVDNQRETLKRTRNKRYNGYTPALSVAAPIQALRNVYDRNIFRHRAGKNRDIINLLSSS